MPTSVGHARSGGKKTGETAPLRPVSPHHKHVVALHNRAAPGSTSQRHRQANGSRAWLGSTVPLPPPQTPCRALQPVSARLYPSTASAGERQPSMARLYSAPSPTTNTLSRFTAGQRLAQSTASAGERQPSMAMPAVLAGTLRAVASDVGSGSCRCLRLYSVPSPHHKHVVALYSRAAPGSTSSSPRARRIRRVTALRRSSSTA